MVKPILYIDMDGVVVEFPETIDKVPIAIRDKCAEWCDKNNKHHSDYPGLFSYLYPKNGAIEAIVTLKEKYSILLLSSAPWGNISSWSDKRIWVERYLPMLGRKCLVLSHRKDLNRGRFLIDDREHNGAASFGDYDGQEWIHFGHGYFSGWSIVVDYLMKNEAGD